MKTWFYGLDGREQRFVVAAAVVVVDHSVAGILVPDLDAEQIDVGAVGVGGIDDGDHEAIVARAVNGARTLIGSLIKIFTPGKIHSTNRIKLFFCFSFHI